MKPVVCIFAHPDDEAFGPGGTIALLAEEREIYIICVTDGSAGKNSLGEARELSDIRKDELLRSTQMLGVRKVFFLDYKDGDLSNNVYHELAEKIIQIVDTIQPDTLLTFELRGVSGHIDHVAVAMITSYVFEEKLYINKLMYYCVTEDYRALDTTKYFIFRPPAYKSSEIKEVYDISRVWEKKLLAMHEHKSQVHDAKRIIEKLEKLPKKEYFLVINK
jgi:LmbE family N-acetylglucosaminyl deacetylase